MELPLGSYCGGLYSCKLIDFRLIREIDPTRELAAFHELQLCYGDQLAFLQITSSCDTCGGVVS